MFRLMELVIVIQTIFKLILHNQKQRRRRRRRRRKGNKRK
jgi:hypothetical protein